MNCASIFPRFRIPPLSQKKIISHVSVNHWIHLSAFQRNCTNMWAWVVKMLVLFILLNMHLFVDLQETSLPFTEVFTALNIW